MSEHFVTTKADIRTCQRCGHITLAGYSEGLIAVVDTTPVDPATEPRIQADGIPTYTLRGGRLDYRDPAYTHRGTPILATHICPPKPQGELW